MPMPLQTGRDYVFSRLIYSFRDKTVQCEIDGQTVGFRVIYDLFFWSMPEVSVHSDGEYVFCEKGRLAVEAGSKPGTVERAAVKPLRFGF